jgi:hypothetical protein
MAARSTSVIIGSSKAVIEKVTRVIASDFLSEPYRARFRKRLQEKASSLAGHVATTAFAVAMRRGDHDAAVKAL